MHIKSFGKHVNNSENTDIGISLKPPACYMLQVLVTKTKQLASRMLKMYKSYDWPLYTYVMIYNADVKSLLLSRSK